MPTESASSGGSGPLAHRSGSVYDVQLGLSFAQSFAYLAYNVTAVAQSDVNGYGPAYLLNGLSNQGYWYQVGVSWDWPSGNGGYYSGFAMNYEVFDSNGKSVFPASGGGGLTTLSGTVNSGDIVLLSLSFSGGSVVMYAFDWNTSAIAQETYAAHGAATFVGQTSGPDNGNGLFTGLMMEWYHSTSSIGTMSPVIFTNSTTALSSGWLWADDWNPNTGAAIFSDHRYFTFSNPSQLQSFRTNGTAIEANGYQFIPGVSSTLFQVPVTFGYSVSGGGVGYSSPTLTYVSNGSTLTATLGSTPQSYSLDMGSTWSVSASLPGSGPTERWETSPTTSGTASTTQTVSFTYYHQYYVTVSYAISGGGSPSAPSLSYYQFGSPRSVTVTESTSGYWADSSQAWSVTSTLSGGSSPERWVTTQATSGTISSSWTTAFGYDNQYYLNVTSAYGSPTGAGWYDAGTNASFSVITPIAGGNGTRYVFSSWSGSYSGPSNPGYTVLTGPASEAASWGTQYYLAVTSEYGTVAGAGWYDSGSTASFSVFPSSVPDGLLTYRVLAAWSGDSTTKASTASVTVDSPRTIAAIWAVDSTQLYLAIAGVVALTIVLGGAFWVRNRRPKLNGDSGGSPPLPQHASPNPFGSEALQEGGGRSALRKVISFNLAEHRLLGEFSMVRP